MGSKSKKSSHKSSSHKKEKKSKKEKRSDNNEPVPNGELGFCLTGALLEYPKLLDELPQIFIAMDKGEYINIEAISNKAMREGLLQVMRQIPIVSKEPGHGWYRNDPKTTVSSYVLKMLVDCKMIVDPKKLSTSEQQASRSAPLNLLTMLQDFPALLDELPVLLNQIFDGNAVQLQNLPNEDLVYGIEKLLKSLGLVETEDGIDIPDKGRDKDLAVSALEHFEEIFHIYNKYQKLTKVKSTDVMSSSGGRKNDNEQDDDDDDQSTSSSSSSSSSSSGSSRGSASDRSESQNNVNTAAIKGPSMPSRKELEAARNMMQSYQEESSDDEIGPHVASTLPAFKPFNQPLGFTGVELFEKKEGDEGEDGTNEEPEITKREEWIMNPGENKIFSDIQGGLTNRKFQTGKIARKKEEALSIQNAYLQSLGSDQQTVEEASVEPSGPSLMEEHLAKRIRKEESEPKGVRRPFDREKDVLAAKKLGIQDVQRLAENSKELSGRFNKAVVQKNFL